MKENTLRREEKTSASAQRKRGGEKGKWEKRRRIQSSLTALRHPGATVNLFRFFLTASERKQLPFCSQPDLGSYSSSITTSLYNL